MSQLTRFNVMRKNALYFAQREHKRRHISFLVLAGIFETVVVRNSLEPWNADNHPARDSGCLRTQKLSCCQKSLKVVKSHLTLHLRHRCLIARITHVLRLEQHRTVTCARQL
jgi:hypothetical protein